MASIIEVAIKNLQDDMRTIPGMRKAPYEPPENIQFYPFCTAFVDGFDTILGQPTQMYTIKYNIVLHLHVSRADLGSAYEKSIKYPEAVCGKLLSNMTLDNQGMIVADGGPTVTGTWQEVTWADNQKTIAWEIRFPFKIQTT